MKTKIMVVEDDASIRIGLVELFSGEGFEVRACVRGDEAPAAIADFVPGIVILDIMLPGISGYDLCRELRSKSYRGRILMLTAKGQELDKVIGLDLGADDYVTKPFSIAELMARVRALLRRDTAPADSAMLGDCVINAATFELKRNDFSVSLTARELKLVQIFAASPGEVLSRDRLLNAAWGYAYYGTTRTLDQTIVQLRKKLTELGANPAQLATVHSVGYRWIPYQTLS